MNYNITDQSIKEAYDNGQDFKAYSLIIQQKRKCTETDANRRAWMAGETVGTEAIEQWFKAWREKS